jgi:GAF domain-containing protein
MTTEPTVETVAALRRLLAEREAERDAARAREAALADVLGVINRNPGDPQPVFDAILEKAHILCGATHGGLIMYDGDQTRLAAERNLPPAWAAFVRSGALRRSVNHPSRLLGELRDRTAELAERNDAFAERIEHQAATIDVLKEMSASPSDAQPVLDLIVRQAHEVCDSPGVMLAEYDGELVYIRSVLGTNADPAVLEDYKRSYPMVPRQGPQTSLYLENQDVHIRDVDAEPNIPAAARATGVRSLAGVPLRRDGEVIGGILLTRSEPGSYSDTQIELLRTFAEQAVIAMENARLLTEKHEALEQQTATAEVLQVINESSGSLEPVFDAMLEHARSRRSCGNPRARQWCRHPAEYTRQAVRAVLHDQAHR